MTTLLKTMIIPLLIILPWTLVSLNADWRKFLEENVFASPIVVFLILLPGIFVFATRITNTIFKQKH